MLLKLQNLRQYDVNNAMKDMVLGAQKQFKDQNNGYLNNGLMAVLKYWDDPDHLFNQYMKRVENDEKKQLLKRDQMEKKMLGYGGSATKNPGSMGSMKTLKKSTAGRHSTALLPVMENEYNLRAMHEIEVIKQNLKDKEASQVAKQQKSKNV